MVYIQRSLDGRTLFFRPAPQKRWDITVDLPSGSQYMFEELKPGEGAWYHITSARPPKH